MWKCGDIMKEEMLKFEVLENAEELSDLTDFLAGVGAGIAAGAAVVGSYAAVAGVVAT